MINSIYWEPIFNFYVQSNRGTLHLIALIHNAINGKVSVDNVVLVYGNNIIQDSDSRKVSFMRASSQSFSGSDNYDQNVVTELLTYELGATDIVSNDYYKPIFTNNFVANNLYVINLGNIYDFGNSNNTTINADYGYKIPNGDKDLPGGLIKIFTNSNVSGSVLLLGSVNINRTPQNTPLEVIIGKTTRIRAQVYKEVSNKETKIGDTKKQISNVSINGILINDTDINQIVYLRDNIYEYSKVTDCVPKCNRKKNYIEWAFQVKPGSNTVSIKYVIS